MILGRRGTRFERTRFGRRSIGLAVAASLLIAAPAAAHIERASYWPDPAAETVGGVPTGGAVPDYRSLFTALNAAPAGDTRIVCQGTVPQPPLVKDEVPKGGLGSKDALTARLANLTAQLNRVKGKGKGKGKKRRKKRKALRRQIAVVNAQIASLDAQNSGNNAQNAVIGQYNAAIAGENAASQADYRGKLLANPSIQKLQSSLADAQANGWELRPSEPRIPVSAAEAAALLDYNLELLKGCGYNSIQAAVTDSGNNDRVVVMPGIYTEPDSRAAPTNDPKCDGLEEVNDRGNTGANSYRYIAECPNDQNLISVLGREPGPDLPPQPPLGDRHGIPDEGACIRCNLQLEGSGISPDDVIVDAGRVESGNGGPADPAKDVGIRADRADGFVLANMTVRHVPSTASTPHEVDGYRLERFKTFQAEEYGVLAFTSDHGLMSDCDSKSSGDSSLYPGSAPDSGEQTQEAGGPRYNTEIRRCDMHHSAAGYSGTAANAVWVHHNDFYDNALGFTTDVFTAAGHPGFPQDSDLIEDNEFYYNNFNPYVDQPGDDDIDPTIPVPVGTGLWIAGGNNNTFRNNRVWDNWRRGTMLFAVPDVLVCGPTNGTAGEQVFGCDPLEINTSHRNKFHDNIMGQNREGQPDPNGTDFWWDSFPGNLNNCWYDNVGKDGTRASLTSEPPQNPVAGLSVPLFLPEDCATSIGAVGAFQEVELLACFANFDLGAPTPCNWFETPTEPAP